jgi:5-methylcytosine-specific restriction endonuclease McrA
VSRHHTAAGLGHTAGQRIAKATLALYGTRCALCGEDGADSSDHRVPMALGGHPTDLANRQPAHLDCNRRRGSLTLEQWFARNPLPTRATPSPSRDW